MARHERTMTIASLFVLMGIAPRVPAAEPVVDLSGYRADSGVTVRHEGGGLLVSWPMENNETGRLVLDLKLGQPLIGSMGISGRADENRERAMIEKVDPVTFLLVGSRQSPADRPPEMSVFNVFFDTPANRPFQAYRSKLDLKRVRVTSQGHRVTVAIGEVAIGPFTGELCFTVYAGAALVHVESVIHTQEDTRAILYDTGLAFGSSGSPRFTWMDTEGKLQSDTPAAGTKDRHMAVRHRALVAETEFGSVACFPPPHQYFFPRDLTDNLRTVWYGKDHRDLDSRFGFGIRQSERGGGGYVPWFNAPPGTDQRLGVFYMLSSGNAERALQETLRYTHGDRFPSLPGYHTFTTHWHMATAMAALQEKMRGEGRSMPDFARMFKAMGVEIVHLAEFHGDGHPQDTGPLRLVEMEAMFEECRRLSGKEIVFLPGEEANNNLGVARPGREIGHWTYLFPRPVYWTMNRAAGSPFLESHTRYGQVYHVGSGAEMLRLLERENGLAWTTHPRIKASNWTPDIFRHQDFYRSDHWLGAAWKAMPADLSHDQLGRRALDLLDDMANWGQKKYMPGEVDVFKIDHTHELYGHMNINYIRIEPDRLPRFDESWQPIVDALRSGRFFVSTGEVLIPKFTLGGQPSGSTVALKSNQPAEIRVDVTWTFPLKSIELISGDGTRAYRERVDCSETGPFAGKTTALKRYLTGRTWARAEAWDIAGNGAFTQPVWLTPAH